MIPLLVGALAPILGEMLDRAFPDPVEREKARADIEAKIRDAEGDFRSFILKYEGEGASLHPAMQVLRSSVRPVLTYALAGLFAWGFVNPTAVSPELMTMLWQLNLVSLGFWYGERALRNLGVDVEKIVKARRAAPDGDDTLSKWRAGR